VFAAAPPRLPPQIGCLGLVLALLNALWGCCKAFKLFGWPRLAWTDEGHRILGYAAFLALVAAAGSGLYNKVSSP